MSLRTLARASALYTLGNIAPKIGAFILLPIYVRFLTQAEYGSIALLTSLSGLLGLLLRFGMDSALMRLHFDVRGRERAGLYSTLTLFTLVVSGGAIAVVAAVTAPFFPTLFAGIPFFPLGALTILIAFTSTIQFVPSVLFRATGQPGWFITYNLGSFVLASAASVLLIVVFGLGASGVLLGQLVGAFVVFVVAVALIQRMGGWTFSRSSLAAALRFGLPLVPHSLSAWALRLSDRWLIGLLIGLPVLAAQASIGVYSFGYQIGYVISIIVVSFNSAWSPYFFRVGDSAYGPRLNQQITTLVVAGLLTLAVGLAALAPEVVAVMAGSRYAGAVDVIRVVAFASVLQGLYTMLVTVVFLSKRTGRLALLTLSSALLNVALNLVLIPSLGIMGAAWSTLAAYAFFAAATWWYARRFYALRLDVVRLGGLGALAAAVAIAVPRVVMPGNPVLQGLAHLAIGGAFAVIAAAVAYQPLMSLRGLTGPAGGLQRDGMTDRAAGESARLAAREAMAALGEVAPEILRIGGIDLAPAAEHAIFTVLRRVERADAPTGSGGGDLRTALVSLARLAMLATRVRPGVPGAAVRRASSSSRTSRSTWSSRGRWWRPWGRPVPSPPTWC